MQIKPIVKRNTKGIWCCRLYLGRDFSGKLIQPYTSFPAAASEEEAQAMAELWAAHLTADGKVKSTNLVQLLREYTELKRRNGASPNTIKQYQSFIKNHVSKYLPRAKVDTLVPADFTAFEQQLLKLPEDGGAGLSRNTVINVHQFLRSAYNYFVASGICSMNPLFNVAKPSQERHEAVSMEEWGFAEIDKAITGVLDKSFKAQEYSFETVYAFAAWLALKSGMRCGEVCALRRQDVNHMQRYIHVSGTVIEEPRRQPYRRDVTKGRRHRNISVTDADLTLIDRYAQLQGKCMGVAIKGATPLVSVTGAFMRPTKVSSAFTALRRSLELPAGITFHTLRHTHASWCLANGVDLKTLSERLGHADEATTLRIYAHVLPGRDRAAAEAFETAAKRVTQTFNLAP